MKVVFYSTHCPRCKILEQKLAQKNIEYVENNNVEEMTQKGLKSAPALEIDGELMDFGAAVKWLNGLGKTE